MEIARELAAERKALEEAAERKRREEELRSGRQRRRLLKKVSSLPANFQYTYKSPSRFSLNATSAHDLNQQTVFDFSNERIRKINELYKNNHHADREKMSIKFETRMQFTDSSINR